MLTPTCRITECGSHKDGKSRCGSQWSNSECQEFSKMATPTWQYFIQSVTIIKRFLTRMNPGEGHGNPLQYSCLENPMDRGAWQATVHVGHKEMDMAEET